MAEKGIRWLRLCGGILDSTRCCKLLSLVGRFKPLLIFNGKASTGEQVRRPALTHTFKAFGIKAMRDDVSFYLQLISFLSPGLKFNFFWPGFDEIIDTHLPSHFRTTLGSNGGCCVDVSLCLSLFSRIQPKSCSRHR